MRSPASARCGRRAPHATARPQARSGRAGRRAPPRSRAGPARSRRGPAGPGRSGVRQVAPGQFESRCDSMLPALSAGGARRHRPRAPSRASFAQVGPPHAPRGATSTSPSTSVAVLVAAAAASSAPSPHAEQRHAGSPPWPARTASMAWRTESTPQRPPIGPCSSSMSDEWARVGVVENAARRCRRWLRPAPCRASRDARTPPRSRNGFAQHQRQRLRPRASRGDDATARNRRPASGPKYRGCDGAGFHAAAFSASVWVGVEHCARTRALRGAPSSARAHHLARVAGRHVESGCPTGRGPSSSIDTACAKPCACRHTRSVPSGPACRLAPAQRCVRAEPRRAPRREVIGLAEHRTLRRLQAHLDPARSRAARTGSCRSGRGSRRNRPAQRHRARARAGATCKRVRRARPPAHRRERTGAHLQHGVERSVGLVHHMRPAGRLPPSSVSSTAVGRQRGVAARTSRPWAGPVSSSRPPAGSGLQVAQRPHQGTSGRRFQGARHSAKRACHQLAADLARQREVTVMVRVAAAQSGPRRNNSAR
jgi:hypothetical protein